MKLIGKRKREGAEKVTLRFDGEVTIYTVRKLKLFLAGEMRKYECMTLDLSGVTMFDSAGFQLLLASAREAERENREFIILTKSNEVERILNLYGVSW